MFGKFFKKPEGANAERTPPGQALTDRFPVMTYGPTPQIDAKSVEVKISGLANETVFSGTT
jgi:DMSO/TMAO reductase YedYZ molybdopterin-dependent catalytic subunit